MVRKAGTTTTRKNAARAKSRLAVKPKSRATKPRKTKPMARQLKPKTKSRAKSKLSRTWGLPAWVGSPGFLRLATILASLMVLLGAALWLKVWISKPETLTIAQVQWEGDFRYYDLNELEALAKPYLATNLYLLKSQELERTLEAHDWVRDVSLRKLWPAQLIISVESQAPIAFWGSDRLLNRYGEIFYGSLPDKQGIIPLIYSPHDNGREMGERYVSLMQSLRGLGLEIIALTENERGAWQMKLRQGPVVLIGDKDQAKRIQRFKVGYERELQDTFSEIERIDLRYTNGFAVKWKQGSKGASGDIGFLGSPVQRNFGS
ncbi:MAG: cell division protein FtsQ [Proteobacteria bacterium]|nr:MAG: cell division protein FtsQ [Pseudomonadota bacterium]